MTALLENKRAGALRLPAPAPALCFGKCAAAGQQPVRSVMRGMTGGVVVEAAAVYVNLHFVVSVALVTRKVSGPPPEVLKVFGSNRTAASIPTPPAISFGYPLLICTVAPSMVTLEPEFNPCATCSALASVAAEVTAARRPSSAAARAVPVRLANLGAATAARMPRIRITTISSMSVKPRVCLFIFVSLTDLTTYRVNLARDLIIHKLCSGFLLRVNPSADCLAVHPLFPL